VAATRRLAAIMFTDIVGYTAATQADEARTLDTLHQQEELVRPLLIAHHGREIKSTGDGFLVEFDSALKATQCAVDIQRRIYERNAEGTCARIQIRIGIHLGDVVQSGTDILGDAVNIAARIEPVAEPGGICVSGGVREQVWNKIPDKLEKLPSKALKGLQVPMELYRVVLPWSVTEPPPPSSAPTGLAVLPFANISPDPKDEYFADGLTEELITVLSQLRGFRVIARTSVMPYKSTSKGVSQIGSELRVSSVLEGSVRKAGNRLRVTAQLIDVGSEGHVWANTYDRELDDVFAVQTELAKQVAEALKIELRPSEEARLEARPTVRQDSYLAYLKGRTLLYLPPVPTSLAAAREELERAVALDPNNAAAHAGLSDATRMMGWWYPDMVQPNWDEISRRSVARAIALDPNLAEPHASLALVLENDCDYAAAEKELKLALSLSPSSSDAHQRYAEFLMLQSRTDEALVEFALAEAADPLRIILIGWYAIYLTWLGKLDEARAKIERLNEIAPDNPFYHTCLAIYYLTKSDLQGCLKELDRWYAGMGFEPRWNSIIRAWSYVLSGEKEQARALLRQEDSLPAHPGAQWVIPSIYCELGDLDESFRWIEKLGASGFGQLLFDPRCEPIRRDPRFQALLKQRKLAWQS
jgi:adenylate cyclase